MNFTSQKLTTLFTDLLPITRMFPGAILAGGLLRDLYFGKEPKDADIFVPKLDPNNPAVQYLTPFCDGVYMSAYEVGMVWSTPWTILGLPVQIIEMAEGLDPIDRVALHDFDFCQAWTEGFAIHGVDKLHRVEETGIVTLVHCEDLQQYARSMRRWDRLSARYPELTLRIPDEISHRLLG